MDNYLFQQSKLLLYRDSKMCVYKTNLSCCCASLNTPHRHPYLSMDAIISNMESMDLHCNLSGNVYKSYTFTLNSASVSSNSNKFYICQIIFVPPSDYYVYARYGRVGEKGTPGAKLFPNPVLAVKEFTKRYKQKTGCVWGDVFEPVPGKYVLMDILAPKVEVENVVSDGNTVADPLVLGLMEKWVSNSTLHSELKSFDIDSEKLPLGKISSTQIQKAMEILKRIENALKFSYSDDLAFLSSSFWTLIPYSHGRKRPPIIDSLHSVKTYVEFLDVLDNLQVTAKVAGTSLSNIYLSIKKEISLLDRESAEYANIQNYVAYSHGHTHKYGLSLENVYCISDEREKDEEFNKLSNKKLLFHGTRTTNFLGILTNGLRLPNSSQVVNGAALGYGIYFADSISKSFNYTTCKAGEIGYVLLCEVALGNKPHIVTHAPFDNRPPISFTSRFAKGEYGYEDEMAFIPKSSLIDKKINSGFIYNEYCVYDVNHYRIRYVLELKRD